MWEYKMLQNYRGKFFDVDIYYETLEVFLNNNEGKEIGDSSKVVRDLGKDGWELVGIIPHPALFSFYYYTFKREV